MKSIEYKTKSKSNCHRIDWIIDEIIKLFEVCNFPKDFGRKLFTTKFSMKQFHSIKWMESNNNLMKYFLKSERKLQFSKCSKHTCNKFQLTIKI